MAKKIMISPVTRIVGSWRIDLEVEEGRVSEAKSSGLNLKGIELIVKGRDPRDTPYLLARICGICAIPHMLAAATALEQAWEIQIPPNALLLRQLMFGAQLLQNHLRHFYLFSLPDFVKGPNYPPFIPRYETDLRCSSQENEQFMQNYWRQLELTRLAMEMVTLYGGKAPHTHGIVVGGVTVPPTLDNIRQFASLLREIKSFINNHFVPDTHRLSEIYQDYYQYGNNQNFLAFSQNPEVVVVTAKTANGGAWLNGKLIPFQEQAITEQLRYAWYKDKQPAHPQVGTTEPDDDKEEAYSWVKAPRYLNQACEVGPLAKLWVAGQYRHGTAAMDRIMARTLETQLFAEEMEQWLAALEPGKPIFQSYQIPQQRCQGVGLLEAFRGCLGHWVTTEQGRVTDYQIVTPSAWNCSPKDNQGQRGPIEAALIGLPVRNSQEPIEVGRVVRSFDPCLSCAVH